MSTPAKNAEDHPAANILHEEEHGMKYKDILTVTDIAKGRIETEAKGDTLSMTIGLEAGVGLNLYMTSVDAGAGRSESIIFAKAIDASAGIGEVLGDREALAEIARQWPKVFGMLMAGAKDVYTDAALILIEDHLMLATKFDENRLDGKDGMDYLMEKAGLLSDHFVELREEIQNNELSAWRVNGKRLWNSCVEGWKAARTGRVIGRAIAWLLTGG